MRLCRADRSLCGMLALACLLLSPTATMGQDAPPATPQPGEVFHQLFPNPTGQNGYEDLVLAGEYARASEQLSRPQEGGATLAQKRAVIAGENAVRALTLLRRGLAKPMKSPRTHIDEKTPFPDLALMRTLARLLMMEQYVLLADGKVGLTIESMRDGLRLGYLLQAETLIGGLVGIAVDLVSVSTLARHLDQLSARDCDRLVALVTDWLKLPDPSIDVLMAERNLLLVMLRKHRADPRELIEPLEDDSEGSRQLGAEIESMRRSNPSGLAAAVDSAGALASARFDRLIADLRRPPWERGSTLDVPPGDSIAERLCGQLMPSLSVASDRFVQDQAKLQLLGVHAALRRYRWEHERLPDSLEALKMARLTTDPFTGQPLVYRRAGETYTLSSAGPFARSDDGHTGARTPLYLVPPAR